MKLDTCMLRTSGMASPTHSVERHAHHAEDQLRDRQHDDHEGAEAERGAEGLGDEPEGSGVDQLADAGREPAAAAAGTGDRDGGERQQRQRVLAEHRARADRQAVGLVLELPRGADRADKRVPARDRAAGDGHEEHRPQRLPRPCPPIDREAEVLDARAARRRRSRLPAASFVPSSGATTIPTALSRRIVIEHDPEADVVHRLREPPDRQVRAQVAEGEQEHHPEEVIRQRLERGRWPRHTPGSSDACRPRAGAGIRGSAMRRILRPRRAAAVPLIRRPRCSAQPRRRHRALHQRALGVLMLAPRSERHGAERDGDDEDRDAR